MDMILWITQFLSHLNFVWFLLDDYEFCKYNFLQNLWVSVKDGSTQKTSIFSFRNYPWLRSSICLDIIFLFHSFMGVYNHKQKGSELIYS